MPLLSGGGLGGLLTVPSPGVAGWVPGSESSLRVWIDGADSSRMTATGNFVSAYASKSPNNVIFSQASSGLRPTFVAGQQYINFAESAFLEAATRLSLPADPALTIVGILQISSTGPADDSRVFQVGGASNGIRSFSVSRDDTSWRYNGGSLNFSPTVVDTPFILSAIKFTGLRYNLGEAYQNGVLKSVGGVSNPSGSGISTQEFSYVGAGYTPTLFKPWAGRMYHLAVFETTEVIVRQKAEGFFAHRLGVQNLLPANHPFKSAPPTS